MIYRQGSESERQAIIAYYEQHKDRLRGDLSQAAKEFRIQQAKANSPKVEMFAYSESAGGLRKQVEDLSKALSASPIVNEAVVQEVMQALAALSYTLARPLA